MFGEKLWLASLNDDDIKKVLPVVAAQICHAFIAIVLKGGERERLLEKKNYFRKRNCFKWGEENEIKKVNRG